MKGCAIDAQSFFGGIMWKKSIKEELFGCFYIHFCKEAIQRWKQIAQKYAVYENEISESILVQNCYQRIAVEGVKS